MPDEPLSGRDALREGGSLLKDAILNQYQAIVALGVGAVSVIAASPLPLLVWLGTELVLLPLIDTPPVRRLVQRKRLERQRMQQAEWRYGAVASLTPPRRARFQQMEALCRQISANYSALNGISRLYLTEQTQKLDHILNSCLHRMLALGAYERTLSNRRPEALEGEIARFEQELEDPELPPRARAALETELDSSYAVLEVLLQNSLSMRDPDAISAELDAIVQQAQDSERAVREMESLMRSGGAEFGAATSDRVPYVPMGTPDTTVDTPRRRVKQR